MTELGEYPDEGTLSQCCAVPMYSQSTLCPRCGEHTGTMPADEEDEE